MDNNTVFGAEAGVEDGVRNSVAFGYRAVADRSNLVVLGSEETERLRVGAMEFMTDEHGRLFFVNRQNGKKYLIQLQEV